MQGDSDPMFDDALKRIRESFLLRLKGDVSEIESLLGGTDQGVPAASMLDKARRIAHGLAGTGLTFGFPQVSASARRLEKYIEQYDGVVDDRHHLELLKRLVVDLFNASMEPCRAE